MENEGRAFHSSSTPTAAAIQRAPGLEAARNHDPAAKAGAAGATPGRGAPSAVGGGAGSAGPCAAARETKTKRKGKTGRMVRSPSCTDSSTLQKACRSRDDT